MAPRGASKTKSVTSKKAAAKPRGASRKPAKPVAPRTRAAKTTGSLAPKPRGAAATAKGTAKASRRKTSPGAARKQTALGAAVKKALPYVPSFQSLSRWVGRTVG